LAVPLKGENMSKKCLGLIVGCILLVGCATGVDNVKLYQPLEYEPQQKSVVYASASEYKPVEGNKILLALRRVSDSRPDISVIGVKKNTYGMPMGKVDVEKGKVFIDLFTQNLVEVLNRAGFEVIEPQKYKILHEEKKQEAKLLLDADVRTFWVECMPGFWAVSADSNVIFEVHLFNAETNQEIWSETFRGKGHVPGLAIDRKGFEQSINMAYSEAMKSFYKVISDENFRQNILK